MKTFLFVASMFVGVIANAQTNFNPTNWGSSLSGYWDFNNSSNLMVPTKGTALTAQGTFTQVTGPTATDFALRKVKGSYLKCTHGVPTNGQTKSNQYSLMIDFQIPSATQWYSFMQTNAANSDDGDLFINTTGKLGVADLTYSPSALKANQWYRLLLTVDAGNAVKMYIDGQLFNGGNAQSLNGRFSLDAILLLLADNDGEDNQMDVASIAIFNRPLTSAEATTLGKCTTSTGTSNQTPTVSITSPANNATFTAPASVVINASATDIDGTISKVDFYNGTTFLGTDNTSPYSYTWSNVTAGSYSITAKATDNSNAITTSSTVSITVNGTTTAGSSFNYTQWTNDLTGFWDFQSSTSLMQATLGNNLVAQGTFTQVAGPTTKDFAVRKTVGNYFKCTHGVSKNGQTKTNQYSLMIDFKVPTIGSWYSFMQTTTANTDDGDLFVNTSGTIGTSALSYSTNTVKAGDWYRLILSVDAGKAIKVYLDGQLWNPGTAQTLNGRYSLDDILLLFADEDGEDNQMDVASIAMFKKALTSEEALAIGGYNHTIITPPVNGVNPYLQTATPTSIYISWHSTNTAQNPIVKFGTTSTSLTNSATGTWENIQNTGYYWHTVKLTNLQPNTEYYYQCYNGTSASSTYVFRTPALRSTPGEHVRMVVLGDNRTDIAKTTQNVQQIKSKLIELYGTDYHNKVDLILNCGDIVSSGGSISQYTNEYFTPFAPLTNAIPTMISIGNHEGNAANYFSYMKYEELTNGYPAGHSYNEKFYNYLYGNVQILATNANSNYTISDQINWLNSRLQESNSNPDIDFVISFLHHPGHSEIWPDGNESFVQNSILPKMLSYPKTTGVFYGHSHNYERGVAEITSAAVTHDMFLMLSGGAGSALDRWGMYGNQTDYPEIKKSLDVYCWTLIDIDVDNKTFDATTYSFGNSNRPVTNEIVDQFHLKLNQTVPATPTAAGVIGGKIITASAYSGVDAVQTCQFQVRTVSGNYSSPLVNKMQDKYNYYNNTGSPNWTPINKNASLDITRLDLSTYGLTTGQTYYYKVRYRDENLKWSAWSTEKSFTYNSSAKMTAFKLTFSTTVNENMVMFTDLSNMNATTWAWDFNNDGVTDSYEQNPTLTLNQMEGMM